MIKSKIRKYHAAVWDEPLVMDLSQPGRRGAFAPAIEDEITDSVGNPSALVPTALKRKVAPELPEL